MIDEVKSYEIDDALEGVERLKTKRREALHEVQRLTNEISHRNVLIGRAYREKRETRPACNLQERVTFRQVGTINDLK